MKIFLDDRRTPPHGFTLVESYDEFVELVNKNKEGLDCVDLDYDLGQDSLYSGTHALKYLKSRNIECKSINIHSTHPTGRDRMLDYAKENFPNSVVTGEER